MARTTVGLDLPEDEIRSIEAWFKRSGLKSQREQVEHITRAGEIVKEIFGDKIPSDASAANALYDLGECFIVGELRMPLPELKSNEGNEIAKDWADAMGMSQAGFDRHLRAIGLLVYEMMNGRPLEVETFIGALNEIGTRLFRANARDARPFVQAYERWKEIRLGRTRKMGQISMRRVVSR